ncbi:amino acid adenylation domain-containing protein [Streptomyces sp. NPDC087300]|uniref:amino acid adenylation domain-containing protein n=1 Tax=Streptomyces sp. NPDC087300 TaxID=3365780 RepID=UPI0037F32159
MDDKRALLLKLLASVQQQAAPAAATSRVSEDIAVIGLAGRFPAARTPDELWRNVVEGRNCVSEVPGDRWDVDEHYHPDSKDGRGYSKWGGWLDDVDKFDPLLFQISPSDAEEMDPQERLFLESAWAAVEDAGYRPRGLGERSPVGVFAGVMNNDYEWLAGESSAFGAHTHARSAHWSIANRVSYVLDLRGPSLTVDSACSASLTAIHLACESLRRGECGTAVAGGVNLILHPMHLRMLADRQMISRGDRCRSFGAHADGFVDGEGVGTVLLKPLSAAEADGDRVYAVLKGSAINAGGRTSGYTVPNPSAQAEVIAAALRRADVDPRTVTYVEAHGTGTPLGDPIEIAGLREAFRTGPAAASGATAAGCAIGSLKSNIGHLESAAGIAGLTKVLMQLKHGVLPPSLHSAELNPDIDLSGTPFRVQQEAEPWVRLTERGQDGEERELPRRAGISSFGGGGANAHLIVEEYRGGRTPTVDSGAPELVVLSALSEERLRAYAGDLADFLDGSSDGQPVGEGVSEGALEGALAECLRVAAEVLRVRPEDLDPDLELADHGLGAPELAGLSERLGLEMTVSGRASLRELARTGAGFGSGAGTEAGPATEAGPEAGTEAGPEVGTGTGTGLSFADFAHTLRVGREQMDVRLAFSAADLSHAHQVLSAVAAGTETGAELTGVELNDAGRTRRAQGRDAGDRLARALADGDLAAAARLWTQGAKAHWPAGGAHRIGLPTYPFARKRYWIPVPERNAARTPAKDLISAAEQHSRRDPHDPELGFYQPVWCPEDLPSAAPAQASPPAATAGDGQVAVLTAGEPDALAEALLHHHPGARHLRLDRDDPAVLLAEPVRHLFHLGGLHRPESLDGALRDGVLALFRTHGTGPRITVVTAGAHGDNPHAAGILGYAQVLAAECPELDITCVDVADTAPASALPALLREPPHPTGRAVLLRGGQRHVRRLVKTPVPAPERSPYRTRGTYLMVGGSGGIGRALSEELARRHRANVVWISRGELGPEQRASADRVREAGGRLLHLRADAADPAALSAAVGEARRRFGTLHGVFHAAMTFNASTIAELTEPELRAALAAKVDGSLALTAALGDEPLDFLAFFSSVGSFVSAAGNAAYVAASSFQDAYGRLLATRLPYPVRVVNWGYWGRVGSGAQPGLQEIFRRTGVAEFTVAEGLDALERVLAHGPVQVMPIRADESALDALGRRACALADRFGTPAPAGPGADAVLVGYDRLSALCDTALLGVYRRMGAFARPGERDGVRALADRLGIDPKYHRLHAALLNILADAGHVSVRGDTVELLAPAEGVGTGTGTGAGAGTGTDAGTGTGIEYAERELDRIAADHPDITATVELTRRFLRDYPQVLRGEVGATEIMFPNASMELVQDFYRGNPLTDSLNELAAQAVAEYARVRAAALGTGECLRVVEFGAGTGATTDRVLPALAAWADRAEYVFTDISPQFLEGAEQRFGERYPFTRFRTLNLERALVEQGFTPGSADVVVATNVVHATGDLRRTLRKARELLRPGGWLVLNELTSIRSSITVTGGVLDGWWAFTDQELRIKDAPLATAGTWQRLLIEEGFADALVLDRGAALGQHVIIGENAGARAVAGDRAPAVAGASAQAAGDRATGTADASRTARRGPLARLRDIVTATLKLDDPVDPDRLLSDYGFDSLSGMKIASVLEQDLGIRLRLSDLLQHSTLRELADHLAESGVEGDAADELAVDEPAPSRTERGPVEFPLSAGQRALSVIERTAPGNYAYNLPLAFWLEPDTDEAALHAALRSMVHRHPQLRVRVSGDRQTVVPEQEVAFKRVRLATSDVAEVREAARDRVREPFDLARGPLLRVTLFVLADGRQVLLLTFHHIVFDGLSIAVFLRELSAYYRQRPPVGEPPATFADFVNWQTELLGSAHGERLRAYWLGRLSGELPALQLPLDRPRPAVPSYRGASVEGRIGARQIEAARRLAADERTSLFTVLLTAYAALLHRYTQQDRILIGTPVAGRPTAQYADVLGYFMNMVVLQYDIDDDQDFRGLLREARDTVVEALEHSDYPLLTLAQELRASRLFDTAFYFQNWVEDDTDTAPVAAVFPGVHQEGEFDVTLEVVEEPEGARYCLKYNPDLLDEDTVRRLGDHFGLLLDAALAEPDRGLGLLPLRSAAELRAEAERHRRARRDYSEDRTLPALLAEQARRTPEAIAVSDRDTTLTYRELTGRVDALAARLRARGVAPGRTVGVLVDRSADMLVALLGVLAAGGAYVPLDPDYPADRLRYMADDAALHLLLARSGTGDDLGTPVLPVDAYGDDGAYGDDAEVGTHDESHPAVPITGPAAQDPAYVIYTSGSTGRPKGVQVPHRALANLLLSMAEEPGLSAGDHLLALTTVCFDIAALELFLPLITGGRVEIVPAEVARDGVLLRRLIESSPATVVQATPATWKMLLAAGWQGGRGLKVLCGGEALDQDTAERLLARAGQVWNMFGPTETTIWSAVCRLAPGERVTIGHPIANTQLYVLDSKGRQVPAGVPGELYIGGAGLATGYLGRPELTADRFRTVDGDRRYRTGDLVRTLPDGRIEYLSRLDSQVKVRGFRIEPAEIETALRGQPGVREAVVVARSVGGDNVLHAFLLLDEGAGPPPREALARWLPAHMVPDVLVPLSALPQTLNGKVDRGRLTAASLAELRGSGATAEADRPAERRGDRSTAGDARESAVRVAELTAVIADILGTEAELIPADVPLGQLGMNSISFTVLSTRISERYGTEVLPTVFYRHPTVAAVAAHLAALADPSDPSDLAESAELADSSEVRDAPEVSGPPVARAGTGDVAIVGMAGRLPGSADLTEFWENLEQGRDLVTEIPADRWDWRAHTANSRSRWGGFLSGVDRFDAAFFAISPREAELMDPQQRLLLEVVWSAIEDAGYRASDLAGKRVGVFIGTTNSDYAEVQRAAGRSADAHTLTGAALSIIPNRISYLLDLRGPSVAVDTACSSSLTAVQQAVTALRDGTCDLAIAGGVSLILDPGLYEALSRNEMLSEDGRCKAFDASANGYVRGEGVGVVVLRDHAAARRDGDPVAAVIKAVAVNHGGRTTSLTSPSPEAQADLLVEAYRTAGVDVRTVGYIEAHGTGTALGDPIETSGLTEAFRRLRGEGTGPGPDSDSGSGSGSGSVSGAGEDIGSGIGIGSVKTNIGHLEAAAGIAGLFKVVLALRHRTLPASLHFRARNPYLELDGSPFEIVDSTRPWPAPSAADGSVLPRRAGVSSFGFGGANAHVVIEEACDAPLALKPHAQTGTETSTEIAAAAPVREDLFVLSAKSERALREQAGRLAERVRAEELAPADVAHTLRVGREPMDERLAFVARGRAELVDHLDACAEGRSPQGVLRRRVSAAQRRAAASRGTAWQEFARALSAEGDLESLAQLWIDGADVDWSGLPAGRRIGLPAYPFEPTRHWVEARTGAGAGADAVGPGSTGTAAAHAPARTELLDENVSTFGTAAFAKHLTGEEFYLADHQVGDERVLPGVVYLEMARLAGERAHGTAAVRRVDEVVWAAPVALAPGQRRDLRVVVTPSGEFEVTGERPHARGRLVFDVPGADAGPVPARIDAAAVRARCRTGRTRQECYDYFSGLGFRYGPTFQVIEELALGEGEALARLRRPEAGAHRFHPSLLDGALQTAGWLVPGSTAHLPYSIGSVRIFDELPTDCLVHVVSVESRADAQVFDITLAAPDGTVAACIERFTLRAVPRAERGVHAFEPVWQDAAAAPREPVELLSVIDTGDGRAQALCDELAILAPELTVRVGVESGTSHLVHLAVESGLEGALRDGFHTVLDVCRTRIAERGGPLRYLYVHEDGPGAAGAAHAALDGFARTIGQEHPGIRMSVLGRADAGAASPRERAELVLAELAGEEPEIRTEGPRRAIRGWRGLALPEAGTGASPLSRAGAHIVTGGSGKLGLLVAERIARHPGAQVVLVSRSRPDGQLPDGWLHVRADVAVRADVERVVGEARRRFGRIAGVVHAAGVLRDSLALRKSGADADAVLAPKVRGLVHLDEATRADDLDYFVAFGSTAAVFGNVGQADYAYANSFLDHYLERRPGGGLAVDWSLWRDGGMTITAEARGAMLREFGMEPLATEAALDGLEAALESGLSRVLLAAGDRARMTEALRGRPAVSGAPATRPGTGDGESPSPAELRAPTVEFLRELLADELKMPLDDVAQDETFDHYGVDSLLVLSLTRALEERFGPLSKTLFFEYLTIGELADFLVDEHPAVLRDLLVQAPVPDAREVTVTPAVHAAAPAVHATVPDALPAAAPAGPPAADDDIVIVGVAGRYPQADDLDQFWRNLRDGKDCVEEVPEDRWDHDRFYDADRDTPGKAYAKWGGWLSDVASFDPMFFRMSQVEAEHIDPQERIFLQTVWHLLEDAGTSRTALSKVRTGVFVGLMYGHYQLYGVDEALRGVGAATSSSYASVANRVSYFFDFEGPSIALDTMCSSSLTALHLACRAIRDGDCEVAVAGGVNVSSHPLKYLQLSKGGFLSTDGRCRSFGEGGDGYVPAEGAGAVLLKRRSAAEADGDRVLAVVRSTAVNHGGAGKGFSVPNPKSQGVMIGEALGRAGLAPGELDYLEAHGTGTSLGDPVEITGLVRAFQGHDLAGVRIPIGSVKSNIGHAESAAGMAAITKVLLQLRHGQLVPSLHAERLNPHLDLDATPFRLQRDLAPWTPRADAAGRPLPRTAGISAFGAGGSNAHVILEEFVSPTQPPVPEAPYVCVLSARDAERLTEHTERLVEFLRGDGRDTRPAALAATLQSREPMAHRVAVVFDDVAGLVDALAAHLAGAPAPRVLTGVAARSAAPAADRTPQELAAAWVRGARTDWPAGGPRVSLPGYPFARERCWLPAADAVRTRPATGAELSRTAARDTEPHGTVLLSTDTPVIAGHRVQGRFLLPAVAHVDLIARVFNDHGHPVERLTVRDLTALRPLDVTDGPVAAEIRCAPAGPGRWQVTVTDGEPYATAEVLVADAPDFPARLDSLPHGTPRPLAETYLRDGDNDQYYSGAARAEGLVRTDQEQLTAELAAPQGDFLVHPALLLGGAVAAGSLLDTAGQAFLPLHFASFRTTGPLTGPCTARVRRTSVSRRGEVVRFSVDFFDPSGRQIAELSELSSKALAGRAAPTASAERPLEGAPANGRVEDFLRSLIADRLGRTPQSIPVTAGYYELGLESVQVLGLVEALRDIAGQELAPTLLFEYTTVRALAAHLADRFPGAFETPAERVALPGGGLDGLKRDTAVPPAPAPAALTAEELDRLIAGRVLARLRDCGAFSAGPAESVAGLARRLSVVDKYRRWLDEAARLLTDTGLTRRDGDVLELTAGRAPVDDTEWSAVRERFAADPYWTAQLSLVGECVDRLPEILSGAVPATDVLFPGGSLAKLTAVYQGNAVADRLNDVVAEVTATAVRRRLAEDASATVRIAEVGAGTGGTTAVVLPHLDAHADRVEYWYTDLSPAFLDQAERRFGPGRDHLRYGRWDVSRPGAGERLTGGDCDVIVATNVLHATQDIRLVLRNLAAALRPGGVLVVNEVTRKSAVLTLTFGLLDGWWLYDDEDVRIPGAPLLSAPRWQEVLGDCGYAEVWRPVAEPDAFGEVFVAQRRAADVPAPEGTRLLAREWQPADVTAGHRPTAVAVLGAGPDARRLADALPGAELITSVAGLHDRFDALVDLGGLALADWLPVVQRMTGREALLLGVGTGDARAGLYGMLQSEYGRVRSRYLEADPADPDLAALVARELADGGDDVEVTYRAGTRHRAVLAELPAATGAPVRFPADAPLLITGGTRGIGLALARHAVGAWGARTLVLTGREQLPPRHEWDRYGTDTALGRKLDGLRALERDGVRLRVLSLPLGEDATAVRTALTAIRGEFGPIGGVLHAAGLVDRDNLAFVSKPVDAVRAVLAPKTAGLDALVEALAEDPLRFCVLFSSVASMVPAAAVGQSDYAMANAHLDAVARRAPHGLPLVSVAWPSWRGVGMGSERPGPGYQATGLGELSEADGLRLLDHVLSTGAGPVVLPAVVAPDWTPRALRARRPKAPARAAAAVPAAVVSEAVVPDAGVSAVGADAGSVASKAEEWLLGLLAEQLGFDRARLAADVSIADYGTDSIMMVQILRRVGGELGVELDPSVLVDHPTVESFVGWLTSRHGEELARTFGTEPAAAKAVTDTASGATVLDPSPALPPVPSPAPAQQVPVDGPFDIAVIGMSGRFPGATDLDAYWRLLSEGRSAIAPVPARRWGRETGYLAGLVELDGFDPAHFHLSDDDAAAMDPQALLLLEETLFAFCDAGYTPDELKGREIGVYVGGRTRHAPDDATLGRSRNPVVAIGQNYLAANLSHYFDLRGPGTVVDTACSSALVAMHHAVQAMRSGDVEAAVVAGITLLPDAGGHRLFDQRGLLNTEPEFHVFDRRARGFTPAEGVGVLLLKPLAAAEADGDRVHAVIKAVAVNNDGRTAGPATPSPAAQQSVMARALARSGVAADDVTYIETNAAGSQVPDLIELKAIAAVYRQGSDVPCSLGSVKPNIGHPQCAEGIAGVIKTVLMLRERRIVPFRSGQQPLEHFDFGAVPLRFARESAPWPDAPLVAAVSSFADGGTNAHVILAGSGGETDQARGTRGTRQPVARPRLKRRRLPTARTERFAIVGMAGHYPGAADLAAFWANLKEGRDSVTEVPAERWASDEGTGSRWGGFLDDVDRFDADFFRISRPEAEITDPQERWFLRTCWEAIEDAGYTPATLAEAKGPDLRRAVGVFAGAMHKDYTLVAAEAAAPVPLSLNQGQIANRVSFVCDFHGPSMTVDTLCSSSLTALHLAVESLRRRECEVAVAGGVNLSLHPGKYRTYGQVGMHSSDGRCRSFGEGGDGYVSAEGVGAVVLKPLAAAEAAGDHIYAVVAATAVNHVGAGSGFSVPSPVGQAAVISAALATADIDARSIGYVEAHGTGTSLGDPIEVRGLSTAFARDTADTGFCALGSVKSNVGHAESAAGIAGLTKAALQLHHRTLVPSLHARTENPLLGLAGTPFRLQRETAGWPAPPQGPRRAGLSSFGATGANAHIVLEEYVAPAPAPSAASHAPSAQPVLVPLSARTDDQLRRSAARLCDALAGFTADGTGPALRDIAYTLQVGRVEWPVRVAFVVRDAAELAARLAEFADLGARQGQGSTELHATARHWADGGTVDWRARVGSAGPGAERPRRVALPTYPFAGDRHWVPTEDDTGRAAARQTAASVPAASVPAVSAPVASVPATPALTAPSPAAPIPLAPAQAPVVPPPGLLAVPRWVEAAPAPVLAHGRVPRRVLIVADRPGSALAGALAEHYRRGEGAPGRGEGTPVVTECPLEGPVALEGPAPDRVHLVTGAAPDAGDGAAGPELALLRLVKAVRRLDPAGTTDLCVSTQDTQSVAGEPSAARGAGLAGLAYFVARDSRRFAVRNLDVAGADLRTPEDRAAVAATVAAEPASPAGDLVALRGGRRYRQEVRPVEPSEAARPGQPGIRPGGTYVVVGGSGFVGRVVSRHLIDRYDAKVVCVGRRPRSDAAVREALYGDRVGYVQGDVTDPRQARRAMAEAKALLGEVHGVLFAGATRITGAPGALADLGEDEFRAHYEVKAAGARHVYEAVADEPLDFLCYFSSAQAFSFGGAGTHAAYAAGITFADAFARSVGPAAAFPVGIVNWGAWRASFGEAAEDYPTLGFLDDDEGAACFDTAVRLLRADRHRQVIGMRVAAPAAARPAVPVLAEQGPRKDPAGHADRRPEIRRLLVERLARTLRVPQGDLSPSTAFADLGVDSITGSTFVAQIGEELGVELNAAALYEFSSAERLADHLVELLGEAPRATPEAPATPETPATPDATGAPVAAAPDDLIATLEARFAAGELSAAEVLDLLDAELATREQR